MNDIRSRGRFHLQRDVSEFRMLLNIPETHLFIRREGPDVVEYMICGKGFDMQGVIHEWSVEDFKNISFAMADIQKQLGYGQAMLLAPGYLRKKLLYITRQQPDSNRKA